MYEVVGLHRKRVLVLFDFYIPDSSGRDHFASHSAVYHPAVGTQPHSINIPRRTNQEGGKEEPTFTRGGGTSRAGEGDEQVRKRGTNEEKWGDEPGGSVRHLMLTHVNVIVNRKHSNSIGNNNNSICFEYK